ncbi:MAG: hypothetical protein A2X12_05835 [Bacteroidetes bacterium GWE2_29_8]|nr:MAG: hypothetical protein A2X12_05835 [Bacteroidetes bacterium GWE2_29_8]OFY17625.1 MAG: hypothetical protein A2X02_07840 [Bacteroidetes bacterium GWF2_29_10]
MIGLQNKELGYKGWSIFLDRDGVINKRIIGGYITSVEKLELLPGVTDAIKIFSNIFNKIIVVTNQQGIGKGLMTKEDLHSVHNNLIQQIEQSGGRIDKVYFSPYLKAENSFLRKPNIGMGLMAKKDFNDINFNKSFMIGDSISDMQFGKRLKMKTVFISDNAEEARKQNNFIDYLFPDLISFALSLNNIK